MNNRSIFWMVLPALALFTDQLMALQVTDNLDIGGAVRTRWDYDPDRNIQKFNFDTLILTAEYTSSTWIGAAKYRFYGKAYPYQYTDNVGDISFPEYAWLGYKFDEDQQVQVGLNQVPFGLQPYFGSTFFETLGNAIGLEDIEYVGTKYIQQSGDWNLQFGYYLRPAWQGRGTSKGGKTYSPVVAEADEFVVDGNRNKERDLFAGRLAYSLNLGDWKSEIGISAMTSSVENLDTRNDGRRNAVALHYLGENGPWGVQLLASRQQISARNPGTDKVVSFGAYDGTFNVAAAGNFYVGDLSYNIPGSYLDGWLSGIKLYGNYSLFDKSARDFNDSQRFILGMSFSVKALWIAVEWLHGKNDLYVGGSDYAQSLGTGGSNRWENQLFTNIGYYF